MNGPKKKGFTLIELLVVVSIIALLVSILLPALNKARAQAMTTQCVVHLRNMALAMHMYSMEYNDYFPAMLMPGDQSPVYPGKSHWHQLVIPFAGKDEELLQCPALRSKNFIDWDSDIFLTGFGLNYNGWNWKWDADWISGDDPDGGFGYVVPETPRGGCIRNARVRRQSEFIMIGDSNDNDPDPHTIKNNFTYGLIGPPRVLGGPNLLGDIPTRHKQGGNLAFMDTHASWYSTTELLSDDMLYMWSRGER